MHVPKENLPRYRNLRSLVEKLDSLGNQLSGLGDYELANNMWAHAARYRKKMDALRVPGKKEDTNGEVHRN